MRLTKAHQAPSSSLSCPQVCFCYAIPASSGVSHKEDGLQVGLPAHQWPVPFLKTSVSGKPSGSWRRVEAFLALVLGLTWQLQAVGHPQLKLSRQAKAQCAMFKWPHSSHMCVDSGWGGVKESTNFGWHMRPTQIHESLHTRIKFPFLKAYVTFDAQIYNPKCSGSKWTLKTRPWRKRKRLTELLRQLTDSSAHSFSV